MKPTGNQSLNRQVPLLAVREEQLPLFIYIIGERKKRILYCAVSKNNGIRLEKCDKEFNSRVGLFADEKLALAV